MWYGTGVAGVVAIVGLIGYLRYLRFLGHVFDKEGAEGVQKVARAVPSPRWVDAGMSMAKVIALVRRPRHLPSHRCPASGSSRDGGRSQ